MRVVGKWLALAGLTLALALNPGAASAKAWKLTSQSKYGLIAVQIPPPGDLFVPGGSYELQFMNYDPQRHSFEVNSFYGWAQISVNATKPYERFRLRNARPGFYALRSTTVLSAWGSCFNGGSYYFEVKPGQVTYVGVYDPRRNIDEVRDAVRTGRLPGSASGSQQFFVVDTPRPTLTLPADDPKGLTDLAAWLRAEQPGVEGQPIAADMTPTTFGYRTGGGLFGMGGCGVTQGTGVPAV